MVMEIKMEIKLCLHCGNKMGHSKAKFCNYCNTSAKRKEMDDNNKQLFAKHNLEYKCKYCERN